MKLMYLFGAMFLVAGCVSAVNYSASCNATIGQLTSAIHTWEGLYGNSTEDLAACSTNLNLLLVRDRDRNFTQAALVQCLGNWNTTYTNLVSDRDVARGRWEATTNTLNYEKEAALNESTSLQRQIGVLSVELERYKSSCPNRAQVISDFYRAYSRYNGGDKECLNRLITQQHESGTESYFQFTTLPMLCGFPADSRTGMYSSSSYNLFFMFIQDGFLQESSTGCMYNEQIGKTFCPYRAVDLNMVCLRELESYDKDIKSKSDEARADTFMWSGATGAAVFLFMTLIYIIYKERRKRK
jgi:hypothetical protein